MRKVKYLVIGAGVSGLTFANYIKDDYLILEKENEVGGYCRTIRKGDFIWDYAGHFFHFKQMNLKRYLKIMLMKKILYIKRNVLKYCMVGK